MSNERQGAIAWFVDNPVAANLLMAFLLIAGYLSLANIPKELLPTKENRSISVSMSYPAASPREVQEGVVLKIEEAILDVEGIQEVHSVASLGSAGVTITVEEGEDVRRVLDDVRTAVERISSFPKDAERLRVSYSKGSTLAMQVQLYGDLDERTAKILAEDIKREMLNVPNIKKVAVWGDRPFEIVVEVPEHQLLKHNISLQQIADRIRMESLSVPSGGIRAENGNIIITVDNQSYYGEQFNNIVLFTSEDGTQIRVRDIATVKDDFVEWDAHAYFDGEYGVGLAVLSLPEQDLLEVSRAVHAYVKYKQDDLPPGVKLSVWADLSYYLEDRLSSMVTNLWMGALLVVLCLIFFMPIKTVFWVILGLPVCFAGTFLLMPLADISINMISLFGFILVLGILVDDAIVISESVDDEMKLSGNSRASVIRGAERVAMPAMFGGLTNMAAFAPLLFTSGPQSHWLFAIGYIFSVCMLVSIVESKLILPSHIHAARKPLLWGPFQYQHRMQARISANLQVWLKANYTPFLKRCVQFRYLTFSVFIAILILSIGLVKSGIVRYELHPAEASDFLQVSLLMGEGTSDEQTEAVMQRIHDGLQRVDARYKQQFNTDESLIMHEFRFSAGGLSGTFFVELSKEEIRELSSFEIVDQWRAEVGSIDGADMLDFATAGFAGGRDLSFVLVSENSEALQLAAEELFNELHTVKGVSNINSSLDSKRQEYVLHLKPKASALGLTLGGVALQVKEAFYGVEAQRIQRDRQEITVMVRYPEAERSSVQNLENMPIRLSNGSYVPLNEVVDIEFVMSPTRLTYSNGVAAVVVAGKVNHDISEPGPIRNKINNEFLPELFKKYPSVRTQLQGFNLEEKNMESSMKRSFILALLGVFVLLCIPLKSYFQPLIIMSVIPFGIVGAILGHWLMGYPFSMMSIFGVIALSGVVVNDSLVMVSFVNDSVRDGEMSRLDAIMTAGQKRFRAIILTTATTFFGVLPMTLETSMQAANMIPMAISLGFGVLFATTVTLILLPCLYMVLHDIEIKFGQLKAWYLDVTRSV